MKKFLKILLISIFLLAVILYFYFVLPFWGIPFNAQRHGPPPLTPAWALECWLWEDDYNTAEFVDELLAGYREHDIPVRTILIDSPWSLRYNDYEVDTVRYPNPAEWFSGLQNNGYRVVLWMTSMVDSYSKDSRITDSQNWYEFAKKQGYLAGDGYQFKWWKGRGGFIDYTNPGAMKWWRGLQQDLFDWGIDGWKLDGTATFFSGKLGPIPVLYQKTFAGWKTTRQYMDLYYRSEYNHGKSQNPEFVTLSRAIDGKWIHPEGFAPIDAAPVTWVGDQVHTWRTTAPVQEGEEENTDLVMIRGEEGIETAIADILSSAELGYSVIGSDIAGFSGNTIPPKLYIRWTQFSAFCGLFMNGGHGERRLWKRSQQELEIIRKYSWLHTELAPYMFSHIVDTHRGGKPLQRPAEGKYHYLFGNDFLIAPIFEDRLDWEIEIPRGNWRYFQDDSERISGPIKIRKTFPLEEYPVFVRSGSIIPLNVSREYTGLGDETSAGYLTLLIYPEGESEFTVYQPADTSNKTKINVEQEFSQIKIHLSGHKNSHILRIHLENFPQKVTLDSAELSDEEEYLYLTDQNKLIIKTTNYERGEYKIWF